MTTVYVVTRTFPYEGSELVGVALSLAGAKGEAQAHHNIHHGTSFWPLRWSENEVGPWMAPDSYSDYEIDAMEAVA